MNLLRSIYSFITVLPSVAIIALLVPLFALRWFAVPADRKRTEWLLVMPVLFKLFGVFSLCISISLTHLRPLKFDLYVFQIDSFFGEPSFRLGHLVASHHWLYILVNISYQCLELAVFGTFATYLCLCSEAETIRLVKTFLLNLIAAVPLYLLFPVCGPEFAFPSFPALPLTPVVPHMLAIAAAPDGVPSVHTSTALLILWFLWRWPWGRIAGFAYLVLIVLATLGSGQHYLFDLLCAIPYTAAILWAMHELEARSAAKKSAREEASDFIYS
jgi:ABC-type proline/glycine betaine transport system permease subunit